MVIDDTFRPELKDALELNSFLSWAQRAPTKKGLLTFSHLDKDAELSGNVLVYRALGGYAVDYTSDEPFNGIWTRYERPGYQTEPFTTIRVCDQNPDEVKLLNVDGCPIDLEMEKYDISIVVSFLSIQVDKKFGKMLAVEPAVG